jgi:hypothetical protein
MADDDATHQHWCVSLAVALESMIAKLPKTIAGGLRGNAPHIKLLRCAHK